MPLISALQDISAASAVGVGTFDLVGSAYSATLSGDLTLTAKHPAILKLDPAAASRDVTLEAEADCPGRIRWVINAADTDQDVVLKNDAGSDIVTIDQNESAVVYCDGTAWTLIAVVAISLS